MIAKEKRQIKSGEAFDHLFPKAMLGKVTQKQGATVADTLRFIPKVVKETRFHTSKIAKLLKGNDNFETCKNIWHFVYNHIAYRKDDEGKEQIRSPARTWHDRFKGVDCDCYTVFISSILSNLKIRHKLRITKYKQDHYQHIYPIVPLENGKYTTIDCVVNQFNYEEPYTEKKDTDMDLEYLNGIPDLSNIDAMDLMGIMDDGEELSELGRLFKKKTASTSAPKEKGKIKKVIGKALHVTNRVNPVTVALRVGILASMKLNILKVAERLKWGYLKEDVARKKGANMVNYKKLKNVLEKLEKIFFGAGGKPENLKNAILTGKGNKNKEVSGLGYAPLADVDGLNKEMPLSRLLGQETFHSELVDGFEGLGELGEPATAASVAAASGVMASIAALLKSIGSIFPKRDKGGTQEPEAESSGDGESNSERALRTSSSGEASEENGSGEDGGEDGSLNFWQKNQKWLKPTAIGVGTIALLLLAHKLLKKGNKKQEKPVNGKPISGLPKSRKKARRKTAKPRSKKVKKTPVAFL